MTALNSGFSDNDTLKALKEKKCKLALEYTNIGVWEFYADLDKVVFSNESKAIIGFQDDTTFGDNLNDWNDRVHPDDREKYYQDFQDHLNGINSSYESEHRVKCKDGSYKWILDRGKIISRCTNGKPKIIIGTHTDISKLKSAEDKTISALNLATEQNNKLRNFAHIVTHNLKQHAGNFESILGFYNETDNLNEKQELVEHLQTISNSLTKTITNLNQIVTVQASKNKKVEKLFLYKELNSILESLDFVLTESNTTIHNNIDPRLFIHYNNSYFESVIQNLLSNAIKYKHLDRDPVVNIDSTTDENYINIIVSDNGRGIDLDKFGEDIFGLYKTFHNNEDSEGVGLYLIKNQIESFGGKVSISSIINVGTTITISALNTL